MNGDLTPTNGNGRRQNMLMAALAAVLGGGGGIVAGATKMGNLEARVDTLTHELELSRQDRAGIRKEVAEQRALFEAHIAESLIKWQAVERCCWDEKRDGMRRKP